MLWQVQAGFLHAAFEAIDGEHGGVERYLGRRAGLSRGALDALEKRYLSEGLAPADPALAALGPRSAGAGLKDQRRSDNQIPGRIISAPTPWNHSMRSPSTSQLTTALYSEPRYSTIDTRAAPRVRCINEKAA